VQDAVLTAVCAGAKLNLAGLKVQLLQTVGWQLTGPARSIQQSHNIQMACMPFEPCLEGFAFEFAVFQVDQ
jgi:hypothetical protein